MNWRRSEAMYHGYVVFESVHVCVCVFAARAGAAGD